MAFSGMMRAMIAGALALGVPLSHAQAATTTLAVSSNMTRPLTLAARQNLNFGQVLLGNFTGTASVRMSTTGAVTCPAGITCTGPTQPAIFNVTGSNNRMVQITTVASDLINASDGSRLRFTPSAAASLILTNSGPPGSNFNVGGSISVSSSTAGGTYVGDIEVTVNYQ